MRNWDDLVPKDVAIRQVQWERRRALFRFKQVSGTSLEAVGKIVGLSATTIGYQISSYNRSKSPVEEYMEDICDLEKLAEREIYSRRMERLWGNGGRKRLNRLLAEVKPLMWETPRLVEIEKHP